jgi:hypothetical protein
MRCILARPDSFLLSVTPFCFLDLRIEQCEKSGDFEGFNTIEQMDFYRDYFSEDSEE